MCLLLVLLDMSWLSAVVHTTHSQDVLGASSCLVPDVTTLFMLGKFKARVDILVCVYPLSMVTNLCLDTIPLAIVILRVPVGVGIE